MNFRFHPLVLFVGVGSYPESIRPNKKGRVNYMDKTFVGIQPFRFVPYSFTRP